MIFLCGSLGGLRLAASVGAEPAPGNLCDLATEYLKQEQARADTMTEVAQEVARHSVGKRIGAQPRDMVVYYEGRAVAAHTTVTEAGIRPLQHVFVDYVLRSRQGD